jgi:hypothetical protein
MRGEEARPVKPERDDLGVCLSPIWAFAVEAFAAFMAGFEKILVRLMR